MEVIREALGSGPGRPQGVGLYTRGGDMLAIHQNAKGLIGQRVRPVGNVPLNQTGITMMGKPGVLDDHGAPLVVGEVYAMESVKRF